MRDPRERGTFSIVACDPDRDYWGVAVATKPASVGALVPFAEWKVGGVATQAKVNYYLGPRGLELLRQGLEAEEVVRRLARSDPGREERQLGVVDRRGRSAAWTGKKCISHALHVTGDGFACQGNMLASDEVVPAMATAFESSRGTLASRLMKALVAGAGKGGDKRGMESAAMIVSHRERWYPRIYPSFWVNLRVDRSRQPIRDLARLLRADEVETRKVLATMARRAKRRRARSP
jgi:uncharacterized Ntn-hydrolase superfamily protein